MKLRNTLPQLLAVLFLIIALASCQEDFSTLGSNIIGGQPIGGETNFDKSVVAYSTKFAPVQTNGLPIYKLGTYTDPVYGKTKVELLTHILLTSTEPDFGFGTHLDSVVLYMPYLSQSTVEDEVTTYALDSVYGSDPINIRIYESNYLLRDFDPSGGLQRTQKYYSDLKNTAFANQSNIGNLLYTIEDFVPSNESILLYTPDGDDEGTEPDETIVPPGIRVKLPVQFWRDKILAKQGESELLSHTNFKNYFRGLYFEVDDQGTDGNLFEFKLDGASVRLYYTFQDTEVGTTTTDPNTGNEVERESAIYTLTFQNPDVIYHNVNMYTNDALPQAIESAVSSPNTTQGEGSLYLRGGEGLGAIIKLFGDVDADNNNVPDELDQMRLEEWLINEANLIFYIDQSQVTGGETEPERIFIYDAINSAILNDFDRDFSPTDEAVNSVINHLGRINRGSDENGDFYKIRITHHVSNLVHHDSTNVPLALVVSQNVLANVSTGDRSFDYQDLVTPIPIDQINDGTTDYELKSIPSAAIGSHEGTVLFGNNTSNEEKRLKLQIYYTLPN